MKVCLLVVFNFPFTANIPLLYDLYKHRFDGIFFLTHKPDGYERALRVEGESYYFHNFFLQVYDQVKGYDYYVFTHDDAILHPQLNSQTMWSRFSIPRDHICLRNIDIVPRQSSWIWTRRGGYDVVDQTPELRLLLEEYHERLCQRFLGELAPFHLSKYSNASQEIIAQSPPMLFGGGANADLMFMPAAALEQVIAGIRQLNFPGFFVEIVVPTAILLSEWPIYLLRAGRHAPIHRQSRLSLLVRLAALLLGDRISYHPIKFGKAHPLSKRLFLDIYRAWG